MITGNINYRGTELWIAPRSVTRKIHGDRIAMVYQDALTSLNPGLSVGYQIAEMFKVHRPGTSRATPSANAIDQPAHPYTVGLMNSIPRENMKD